MSKPSNYYDCLRVPSGLKDFVDTTLKNSWVKQPSLSIGAGISLYATLASRKFIYQGLAPNVYVALISPSGTGKSFPQEAVKDALVNCGAQKLLGTGDYGSYQGIMDSLAHKPVRLDILDEMGGILKVMNSDSEGYNAKIDDILAELYTTSNSFYMGRVLAEGVKGQCFRPNVNILGATTPAGFEEGVNQKAIDKGLLGRFLVFNGNPHERAERVKKTSNLQVKTQQHLAWLFGYSPEENKDQTLKGIEQSVTELTQDTEADGMLDNIFREFDQLRIDNQNVSAGPIIARLYQQMIKLVIIHAISRGYREVPTINKDDVLFGYEMISLYHKEIEGIIENLVFSSKEERDRAYVFNAIRDEPSGLTKAELMMATKKIGRGKRHNIIQELLEVGRIVDMPYKDEMGNLISTYKATKGQ